VKEPDSYLGAQVSKFYAIDGADDPENILKPGSVKEPDSYLGAQEVSKFYTIDSADDPEKPRWAMYQKSMPNRLSYRRPELDQLHELEQCEEARAIYQSLIGVLQWICEIGHTDVLVVVSMLSRYVVSPCEGRLQQELFHICLC
jgi:hypothetical protein